MAKKIVPASANAGASHISTPMQNMHSISVNNPSGFLTQMVLVPLLIALTTQEAHAKVQKLNQIHQMLKAVNNYLKSQLPAEVQAYL